MKVVCIVLTRSSDWMKMLFVISWDSTVGKNCRWFVGSAFDIQFVVCLKSEK